MPSSLKDVAARAGVSVKTVSNVVNGYPFISVATRGRVEAAIVELNYRPNASARRLRTGRSGLIALSVPEIDAPYFAELASHIVDAAEQRGWTVLIDKTGGERSHEQLAVAGIRSDLIDGAIASPLSITTADITAIKDNHPLVLLGEKLMRCGVDHVAVDSIAAAREMTEHLIAAGGTRIAAIGMRAEDDSESTSALRIQGFLKAMAAAGRPVQEHLIATVHGYHRPDGYTAMRQLLALSDPPDAVFCFNDLLALGAIRAIHDAGLRVPEDVLVTGFDDIEEARFSTPRLTTIAPDKGALAEAAVELLARQIAGLPPETKPQEVLIPYRLIVRQSTAANGSTGTPVS